MFLFRDTVDSWREKNSIKLKILKISVFRPAISRRWWRLQHQAKYLWIPLKKTNSMTPYTSRYDEKHRRYSELNFFMLHVLMNGLCYHSFARETYKSSTRNFSDDSYRTLTC